MRHGETRKNFAAGAAPITVTVAAALSAVPQELLTRTQKLVVWPGDVVSDAPVAPPIGLDVLPDAPMYHWYASDDPVAPTVSVTVFPTRIVPPCGCDVIAGAVQVPPGAQTLPG